MKVKRVTRIGTTVHNSIDIKGNNVFLLCVSYHLTQNNVRLFSPQTYHHMYGGNYEVHCDHVNMRIPNYIIDISINSQ